MNVKRTFVTGSIVLMFGSPVSRVMAGDADAGKALFTKNCQGCHGADGKGNAAMAKALGEMFESHQTGRKENVGRTARKSDC